jgi:predicted nucleotidyltransferase component of viral defense system
MIRQSEIKSLSRQYSVPVSTIERDYVQNWLLKYLPDMAFKGGTCLRKIYFKNYRFSDDLDFTLLKRTDITNLENNILKAVIQTKTESKIEIENEINSKKMKNGYSFDIYFRITRVSGSPIKIKIDITKYENEKIINQIIKKEIKHPYSEKIDAKVLVYSLNEIFAEKTRSLFERTRPRDIYDVWHLKDNIAFDRKLFKKKCEFKNFKPNIDELLKRKTDFIHSWENSLKHQLKELPNPEKTFENVIKFLSNNI